MYANFSTIYDITSMMEIIFSPKVYQIGITLAIHLIELPKHHQDPSMFVWKPQDSQMKKTFHICQKDIL